MSRLPFVDSLLQSLSVNPTLVLTQVAMFTVAVFLVFLVLFTTRDVIVRSRSFLFQLFSIVLVAALPVVGFLVYILVRPSSTERERALEATVQQIMDTLQKSHKPLLHPQKTQSSSFKMQAVKQGKAS